MTTIQSRALRVAPPRDIRRVIGKVAGAAAALWLVAFPARADDVAVSVAPSLVSQYMFRGVRLGGLSFEPSVEADWVGAALGIWANFPSMAKVDGLSNTEVDPYGSYTIAINASLSLEPGFTVYTYPKADTGAGWFRSTFEPFLSVNYTVAGVMFTPKLYYDVVLEGPTLELTAAYSVPLGALKTSLALAATAGTFEWDNAASGASPRLRNWGDYWQIGATLPFTLSKRSTLTLGFAYTEGVDNYYRQGSDPRYRNDAAVGRGVASVAYAWNF